MADKKTCGLFRGGGHIESDKFCFDCVLNNCCKQSKDGMYTELYDEEIKFAKKSGWDMSHLTLIKDFGAKKHYICSGNSGMACIGKYKPLDCCLFPLYPVDKKLRYWCRAPIDECQIPDEVLKNNIHKWKIKINSVSDKLPSFIEIHTKSVRKYIRDGRAVLFPYHEDGRRLSRIERLYAMILIRIK